MARYTIVTMPGDSIGNQVLPEELRVLGVVGLDADYVHADIGWECWINEGNALPERRSALPCFASHVSGYIKQGTKGGPHGGKVRPE